MPETFADLPALAAASTLALPPPGAKINCRATAESPTYISQSTLVDLSELQSSCNFETFATYAIGLDELPYSTHKIPQFIDTLMISSKLDNLISSTRNYT